MSEISKALQTSALHLQRASEGSYPASVAAAIELLAEALMAGRKLLVFGNGGSAADAEHICAELVGRFVTARAPLAAIALTTNTPLLTAWSNDVGFDDLFARQIEALGHSGDVAWGISTSGSSANVVAGLARARATGLRTIGLTGAGAGRMREHCDVLMEAPAMETPRIQEIHLVTYHAICAELERRVCGVRT
jgi:D-sedoheptulose 7-phosphate isomerase